MTDEPKAPILFPKVIAETLHKHDPFVIDWDKVTPLRWIDISHHTNDEVQPDQIWASRWNIKKYIYIIQAYPTRFVYCSCTVEGVLDPKIQSFGDYKSLFQNWTLYSSLPESISSDSEIPYIGT